MGYTYISEFMLWLHALATTLATFVIVKWVKIPSLGALQVAEYIKTVENIVPEPLKNRTYLRKKLFFNFLGADFLAPKTGHRREKQPVLEPVCTFKLQQIYMWTLCMFS